MIMEIAKGETQSQVNDSVEEKLLRWQLFFNQVTRELLKQQIIECQKERLEALENVERLLQEVEEQEQLKKRRKKKKKVKRKS